MDMLRAQKTPHSYCNVRGFVMSIDSVLYFLDITFQLLEIEQI